jgi:alpha-L-fucosidase
MKAAILFVSAAACAAKMAAEGTIVKPSQAQLDYQELEMGALFQYNIGLYGNQYQNNYACNKGATSPSQWTSKPTIDTDQWVRTAQSAGLEYAVLTTQAGCGFLLFDTNSTIPKYAIDNSFSDLNGDTPVEQTRYYYTLREAKYQHDLVRQFVDSCKKYNMKAGVYYITNNNVFCGVHDGVMAKEGGGHCGTQEDFYRTMVQQLTELWSGYGDFVELWFDGGFSAAIASNLTELVGALQPGAIKFQGPGGDNTCRWGGAENGQVAGPDNWSTAQSSTAYGVGDPAGPVWSPAECDITLNGNGMWYWVNNTRQAADH